MPVISAADLEFAWPGGAGLSIDALSLIRGWTAVVGPNGAGKTTLLRLLAGELTPHAGTVRRPPGLRVAVCPQRVDALDGAIEAFAWAWDPPARRWRSQLALEVDDVARWAQLSPGERKRWQLGAALAAEPGLLLLDEPTNHLDADGRALLRAALARFEGVGLVVTHDRALMDGLAQRVLWVEGGGVQAYDGPYAAVQAQRAADRAQQVADLSAAQARRRALTAQLAQARRDRAGAGAARIARHRMRGPKDADARGVGAQRRAEKAEAAHGARAGRLRHAAQQATAAVQGHGLRAEVGGDVWLAEPPPAPPVLVRWQAPTLCAGDRVLATGVDLAVARDARIWLRGPNGAGKSTALRALLAQRPWPADRLLALPQHLPAEAAAQHLAALRQAPPAARDGVLQRLAALGVRPAQLLASVAPSPGEGRLLALADGLRRAPWLVALDEPTNHLALPTIERLEVALAQHGGALVLVTHDAALAARLTRTAWTMEGGRVQVSALGSP